MLNDNFVTFEIGKAKHIALVAHDGKKKELIEWCDKNKEILKGHFLCGTGTTARLIAEKTGLPVKGYNSGPLGGDQQVGAKIVEGQIDFMIFLWDPLEAQPHDPDVRALSRIAVLYDIPTANNLATADFMLKSEFMNSTYERKVENFNKTIQDRVEKMKQKLKSSCAFRKKGIAAVFWLLYISFIFLQNKIDIRYHPCYSNTTNFNTLKRNALKYISKNK